VSRLAVVPMVSERQVQDDLKQLELKLPILLRMMAFPEKDRSREMDLVEAMIARLFRLQEALR
jgi:hypothetical protein